MKFRLAFAICLFVGAIAAYRADAASLSVAGHTVSCGSTPVIRDRSLLMEGRFVPGRGIFLNPDLMRRQSGAVRLFIFKHECAHKIVGGDELAADCAAARSGAREKWLTPAGVDSVCRSLSGEPAAGRYASGSYRCANIRRCYANSSETIAHRKTNVRRSSGSGRFGSAR